MSAKRVSSTSIRVLEGMFSKVSNPYKTLILLQSLLDCQLNFNNYSQDVPNTCRIWLTMIDFIEILSRF